jgi:FG-GAP-like repeat/Chaperone of endosialidase
MKTKFTCLLILLAFLAGVHQAAAQGTAFTYQGRLIDGGFPATGIYDLQFKIYDAAGAGSLIAGPLTNSATGVTNGLFNVTLDFGAYVFTGSDRWLEVGARTNGTGTFVTLNPREKILPEPYAIFAGAAATSASYAGPVSLAQLPPAVALLNGNQTFTGAGSFSNPSNSFAGSGGAIAGVRFSTLDGSGIESIGYGANFVFNNYFAPTSSPVAVGDMNLDGRTDLICVDTSGNVLVMTNNGNSSFGLLSSNSVGAQYVAEVLDVNHDGKPDVMTLSGNNVVILTNAGNGMLALASINPTGSGPGSLATADFNGDGRPDVVTAGGVTVTVLTNNGNCGFGLYATITQPGANIWDVIAADVNNDNRPDIIWGQLSTSIVSGNLTIFTNSGTAFVLASTPTTGVNPLNLAAADLNGDGHIDLISSDYGSFGVSTTISVLINDGAGNFNTRFQPSVGTTTGPWGLATADVNGDGKVDVLCATSGGNSQGPTAVIILTNDGSGLLQLSSVLSNQISVLTADVNGDGRPDIISSIRGTNGNLIVTTPNVWLNSPLDINFLIPITAESDFTVDGIAVLTNLANRFYGNFIGNGTGLGGLDAGKITLGTISDARLSANVALRAGGNAFTGNQTIAGSVGIGISPLSTLDVNGTARIQGANNWDVTGTEGDFRVGNDVQRFKIGVATNGSGTGDVWMRAQGGTARVFIKTPGGTTFFSNEGQTAGVSLAANGTAWAVVSDRNVKKDFAAVDSVAILEKLAAMPITQWHYKWETADVTPHIGPMAQDFKAAFYPGTDDKSITTQEADGVTFAAIQGLNQKLEETRAENAELKHELADIKQMLAQLTHSKN